MLKLYNSLTRALEPFEPLKGRTVGLYTCGPTVYAPAHLGNLRTYLFEDVLKRVLRFDDYAVKHVMNITDVGHLTSDDDEGEDKVEQAAAAAKRTAWDIVQEFTETFQSDLVSLNVLPPDIWSKATDHIPEQIELVRRLQRRGFTYRTSDGVYFDTSKFPGYGRLANLTQQEQRAGAPARWTGGRVAVNPEKRHPRDFALWKLTPKGVKRQMEWKSPWGKGFPGWHLECSAMSMKYLGQTFDIHCGGVDHIPVHHTNEIAQSEAATGKPLARFWLHGEFLIQQSAVSSQLSAERRMGKSEGNMVTLNDLTRRGFSPLAFRLFALGAHYRSKLTFSWDAIQASQNALDTLFSRVREMTEEPRIGCAEFEERFTNAVNDDLNTPQALAVMWELLKSDYPLHAKKRSLLKFDEVLGMGLAELKPEKIDIPADVAQLVEAREQARKAGDFAKADELRKQVLALGFAIDDTDTGPKVKRA